MILKKSTVTLEQAKKLESIRVIIEHLARCKEYEYVTHVNFDSLYVRLILTKGKWKIAHIFSLVEYDMSIDIEVALDFQVDKLIKQLEEVYYK